MFVKNTVIFWSRGVLSIKTREIELSLPLSICSKAYNGLTYLSTDAIFIDSVEKLTLILVVCLICNKLVVRQRAMPL